MIKFSYRPVAFLLLSTVLAAVLPGTAFSQQDKARSAAATRRITGSVVGADNTPVVGATVLLKGTRRGVSTGTDGSFTLDIPAAGEHTLVISFIGMIAREIEVTADRMPPVRLQDDTRQIEDVIVTGYGRIQKKSDMVGSAYQVTAKDLAMLPATRIDNVLDGLVPGLSIKPNADYASARDRYEIRVRGGSSLSAGEEPLWIVDGIPQFTGGNTNIIPGMDYSVSPLSFIDLDDIESITVLKDAAETAIYGVDGSNGVIVVTTKSGQHTDYKVSAKVRIGFGAQDRSTAYRTLNGPQYLALAEEAWINAGKDMSTFPYQDNPMNSYSTTDTDWYDIYYGKSQFQRATVNISGGTERATSYASLSYHNSTPVVKGNQSKRIAFHMQNDYAVTKRLKTKLISDVSYNVDEIFSTGNNYYTTLPIFSPYNEDGETWRMHNTYYNEAEGELRTQRFFSELPERELNDNRQRAFRINAVGEAGYTILPGLEISAMLGANYHTSHQDVYHSRATWSGNTLGTAGLPVGYSNRDQTNALTWINVDKLTYSLNCGRHSVSAMALLDLREKSSYTLGGRGMNFSNDKIREITYAGNAAGDRTSSSSSHISRQLSYMLSAQYSFDGRYSVMATIRRDGTSSFGEYPVWGYFPSAGAAWNIHREKFFPLKNVHNLKLRASYGLTGNSRIDDAVTLGVYTYSGDSYYNTVLGSTMDSPPNAGLHWEYTHKANIGLDVGLFKRLDIAVEYYYHKTVDMLAQVNVSRALGDTRLARNIGSMRNSGVEVDIASRNIQGKNFSWITTFNLSHNSNKILSLGGGREVSFTHTSWIQGQDKNVYTLIRWAGVDPRDGNPLWYDRDGNITRTYNYNNRVPYKKSTPDVEGGMVNRFTWKNFTFSFNIIYGIGGWAYSNYVLNAISNGYGIIDSNQAVDALYRWRKPGDLASGPKNIYLNPSRSTMVNTRGLYNKSHLRINNAFLQYYLPERACHFLGIQQASVDFTVDNLAVFSMRKTGGGNSYKNLMYGNPLERVFSLGINMTF